MDAVDPNAPQEPLDSDAQAEVDGGNGGRSIFFCCHDIAISK